MADTNKGKLIALSAPSGAGKSTICKHLLERNPDFRLSISATTRAPRFSEKDGVDYFFLDTADFLARAKRGEFLEFEEVHGNYYGTLRSTIEQFLDEGKTVLLDIDVNGALNIKQNFPTALLIFIKPPSIEALKTRLRNRKTETSESIERRLQRMPLEYTKGESFDVQVINDDLQQTIIEIERLIRS